LKADLSRMLVYKDLTCNQSLYACPSTWSIVSHYCM